MDTAVKLNEVILGNSAESQLVILDLPKPRNKEDFEDYVHYLEVLSKDVSRILFVRGSGAEVITTSF